MDRRCSSSRDRRQQPILQLLGEIPKADRPLSHQFRTWVDNFRFDKIIALTEDTCHE